jgi:hypothetical protein
MVFAGGLAMYGEDAARGKLNRRNSNSSSGRKEQSATLRKTYSLPPEPPKNAPEPPHGESFH